MYKAIVYRSLQLILLLSLFLLSAKSLLAHGVGELQITLEPVGPYLVSVWTYPQRLMIDTPSHITVSVADEAENFVLDAEVQVTATLPGTAENLSAQATSEQATNKLFYEAYLVFPQIGRYDLTVLINGSQGNGELNFPLEIREAGQTNWFLIAFIAVGLVISMIMFRMWERQPNTPVPRRK
jgi:hypothetical protein